MAHLTSPLQRGGYLYFCFFYGLGSGLFRLSPDTRDRLKSLGFSEWLEAKKLALPPPPALATFRMTPEEKKRKRTQFLKEAFVTEDIKVDGMNKNLIPPPVVVPIEGLVIKEPELGIFYMNMNTNIVFQREKVMKGLFECKASESNIRRIQVKNIVKEFKDYLNTYSSARMDISWHRYAVSSLMDTAYRTSDQDFKEFNYLLQIEHDVLTKDIDGFKTYEDYKDDWIYERNKDVPWTDNGIWEEPVLVEHNCELFSFKSVHSEWPTCSWKDDGYCNGGNLSGAYIVGNTLCYQDLEWYEALEVGKLKDEALLNKPIMEGTINEEDDKEQERCKDTTYDALVCKLRRFEMIKYSFENDEKYVTIKEDEYDNLTTASKDAFHAYQEIFHSMDEGWVVKRDE
nr:hypothetical protein [Tanacetum cinerariifolium]